MSLDIRQIAVFVPLLAFCLGAIVLSSERSASPVAAESLSRDGPIPVTESEPPAPPADRAVVADWWSGKEDLRRRLEREKYFSRDAAPGSAADYETKEEAAEAVANFVFKEFRTWARSYRRETDARARRRMLDEGVVRATIRRPHMERLMRADPRAALKEALPLADYAALPPEMRAHVEKPFSAFVTIRRNGGARDGKTLPDVFSLRIRGEEEWLSCALLNRRSGTGAKTACPAQGIRLGDFAVLRDDVIQVLGSDDASAARALFGAAVLNPVGDRCFASGTPVGSLRATGLAAGSLFVFENERALWSFNRRIGALDAIPRAVAGSGALFHPRAAETAAAGFDFAAAENAPSPVAAE